MFNRGHTLFETDHHKVVLFHDLVKGAGIQANQFLIINGNHSAVIDPGGDLTYAPLSNAVRHHTPLEHLDYIIASHQDPDIIASIGSWMMQTKANVICSSLWSRFLPHLVPGYLQNGKDLEERIHSFPDQGGVLDLDHSEIHILPGHFLHSVGNFHFYDTESKILLTGDLGASTGAPEGIFVDDFEQHIQYMKGFHQRYMCSSKVLKLWVNMVRTMDVDMIVPQHGPAFKGQDIERFLTWLENLKVGIDLVSQADYQAPKSVRKRALNY